jgi:glycogen phosphorylase
MNQTIAYFCAEYAIEPALPIYAGGLGILAGDYVREANDQNLPLVAVGLFYQYQNTATLDVVRDEQGKPLLIEVPIQDKKIKVRVCKKLVGDIPIYLLDTNIEENDVADRRITDKLYVLDKETRLKQELVFGIGGQRVLEALNIHPLVYHLNEGHSAFLGLELIRHEMEEHKIGFAEGIIKAKNRIVFTNHTLVAAGHDIFSDDLVSLLLTGYAQEIGVPVADVIQLGLVQESSAFSMTMLSLRMAGKINAVSKLHAQKAAQIWTHHAMIPITNGIHIATWDKVKELKNHEACKQDLLNIIQKQTGVTWQPHELLLGWARRFVEYKRPLAILDNLDRFIKIAQNNERPVKLVFSGKPHISDENGKRILETLLNRIENSCKGSVVYLPDYTMELAQTLVAGCDVWLNTPVVGYEACGTSGMKAALNGVLPCSTPDGWIAEAEVTNAGWLLDSDHITEDIQNVLEQKIVPMYYEHQDIWQEWMKNARAMIVNEFTTTRMMNEYKEKMYS